MEPLVPHDGKNKESSRPYPAFATLAASLLNQSHGVTGLNLAQEAKRQRHIANLLQERMECTKKIQQFEQDYPLATNSGEEKKEDTFRRNRSAGTPDNSVQEYSPVRTARNDFTAFHTALRRDVHERWKTQPRFQPVIEAMLEGLFQPSMQRADTRQKELDKAYHTRLLNEAQKHAIAVFRDPTRSYEEKTAALHAQEDTIRIFSGQTWVPEQNATGGQWQGGTDASPALHQLAQDFVTAHVDSLLETDNIEAAHDFMASGTAALDFDAAPAARLLLTTRIACAEANYKRRQDEAVAKERWLRHNQFSERVVAIVKNLPEPESLDAARQLIKKVIAPEEQAGVERNVRAGLNHLRTQQAATDALTLKEFRAQCKNISHAQALFLAQDLNVSEKARQRLKREIDTATHLPLRQKPTLKKVQARNAILRDVDAGLCTSTEAMLAAAFHADLTDGQLDTLLKYDKDKIHSCISRMGTIWRILQMEDATLSPANLDLSPELGDPPVWLYDAVQSNLHPSQENDSDAIRDTIHFIMKHAKSYEQRFSIGLIAAANTELHRELVFRTDTSPFDPIQMEPKPDTPNITDPANAQLRPAHFATLTTSPYYEGWANVRNELWEEATPKARLILTLPIIEAEIAHHDNVREPAGWNIAAEQMMRWASERADAEGEAPPFWISWDLVCSTSEEDDVRTEIQENISTPETHAALRRQFSQLQPGEQFNFVDLENPHEWHQHHFQYYAVGGYLANFSDFMHKSGVQAALGRFTLYAVPKGYVSADGKSLHITGIGLFIRDSFDFNGEQFLGSWDAEDKNILRMQSLFDVLSFCFPETFSESSKALTNRDFREFREQTGYGRDFYVYTPMEKIELSEEKIIYFDVQPGAPEE